VGFGKECHNRFGLFGSDFQQKHSVRLQNLERLLYAGLDQSEAIAAAV